jgi:hypothetical protein
VVLITIEAKYIATNVVSCELVWIQKLLEEIFDLYLEPNLIYCDNKSCRDKILLYPRHGAERSYGALVHIHI